MNHVPSNQPMKYIHTHIGNSKCANRSVTGAAFPHPSDYQLRERKPWWTPSERLGLEENRLKAS